MHTMKKKRASNQYQPYKPRPATLKRKQAILDCIRRSRGERGISPTYDEIAAEVYDNPSYAPAVHRLVLQLIDEGFLVQVASGARTLVLALPQPRAHYYQERQEE